MIQRGGEYAPKGMTRDHAMTQAKRAAAALREASERLEELRPETGGMQRHIMDGVIWRVGARLEGFDQRLAAFEGGLGDVDTCDGFWECWGFQTACEAAGGTWEDLGACVESCTTEDP